MTKPGWGMLLALGVLGGSASAQTVEGTIINSATGAGVVGANVMLFKEEPGSPPPYSTTTDAQGNFRIQDVKDGPYVLQYNADGYFPDGPEVDRFRVAGGGAPIRLEGRLRPMSLVSGRVIDTRGDPVPGAQVRLLEPGGDFDAGGPTDAKGNFQIAPFAARSGTFRLAATAPANAKPPAPDPESGEPRAWAVTFYPGATNPDQAGPITLSPGTVLEGLALKLVAVPAHAVRGVVLNPDGTPAAKVRVALIRAGITLDPDHTQTKEDGTFEFPAVTDGPWRLFAEFERPGYVFRANQWFEMTGHDADTFKLRLSGSFSVTGTVILETPEGIKPPRAPGVGLMQFHDADLIFTHSYVLPEADGRFRIEHVYAGTYQVMLGKPPGYYLDAIRLGDKPAPDLMELSQASPELTIVYKTAGAGTVRGTVEKCGNGGVWLAPVEHPRWRMVSGACDAAGRFAIGTLRPGEYYAVALAVAQGFGPAEADAAFVAAATRVTVRAGETTQLDLALGSVR